MRAMVIGGRVRPLVSHALPMERVGEAHAPAEGRGPGVVGKVARSGFGA